jgi:hypothetical protein
MEVIYQHMSRRLQEITSDSYAMWDAHSYIELHDLLVARLTLFNGRRGWGEGVEPSRLTLQKWNDAKKDVLIPEINTKITDSLEPKLLQTTKTAYMVGKETNHLVSVLMPQDTLKGLRIISSQEVRKAAGVNRANPFLFPHVQKSMTHMYGWKAPKCVCLEAEMSDTGSMTATRMRHWISTFYASMDVLADR